MSVYKKIKEFILGKDIRYICEQFATERNGILKSESGDLFVTYEHSGFRYNIANKTYYVTSGGRTFEKKYMIGIVEFFNPIKIELCITQEDILTKIGKVFNRKDITINNKDFDKKYFLQSNHEYKAIAILKNEILINQIITLQPDRLEIINDKGLFDELPEDGKYMLYYVKQEKLKTIEQLNNINFLLNNFIEILKDNYSIH